MPGACWKLCGLHHPGFFPLPFPGFTIPVWKDSSAITSQILYPLGFHYSLQHIFPRAHLLRMHRSQVKSRSKWAISNNNLKLKTRRKVSENLEAKGTLSQYGRMMWFDIILFLWVTKNTIRAIVPWVKPCPAMYVPYGWAALIDQMQCI